MAFAGVMRQHAERKAQLQARVGTNLLPSLTHPCHFSSESSCQQPLFFYCVCCGAEATETAAEAAVVRLSSHLIDHLNEGVVQVYANQQKIDQASQVLQANAARFSATTQRWLGMYNEFNDALKVWAARAPVGVRVTSHMCPRVSIGRLSTGVGRRARLGDGD
jgi:hypothetical protein